MNSGKSIPNLIVLLMTVFILAATAVTALTEDFTAYANSQEVPVCACDLRTDHLTVQNTGDITSTFMVIPNGEAGTFTDLAPQTFILQPGEAKQVERFIKVPCSARGDYTLNTTVKTLFDTEKFLIQTLEVDNCDNVQIIPRFSGTLTECPCTPVQYSFDVVNTGNHIETYEISVEPYSDAISLSTDLIILEPGEKQEIIVFINLPCGEYGDRTFTFNALARGTKLLGQVDFNLDIQKCYDFALEVGDEYEVCKGVANALPFSIRNDAQIANEYYLSMDVPEWVYMENGNMQAWGGETVQNELLMYPPFEDEDLYPMLIRAESLRGEEVREKEVMVSSTNCYDYQLFDHEDSFFATECVPKDQYITIKNIGTREAEYIVELEGLEWLTVNDPEVFLLPGEETVVSMTGYTPCESAGDYLENIYVTVTETNQTFVEEKIFTIYTPEEAHMPEITIPELNVDFEGGEVEGTIKNIGTEYTTYDLSLAASNWISLDTARAELEPGEETTFTLMAYPSYETEQGEYAGELVATYHEGNIEYAADILVSVEEKQSLLWLWILIGSVLAILIIIAIILIVVLSSRKDEHPESEEDKKPKKKALTIDKKEYKRKQKDDESKGKIWPIILILIIAAILVGGALYYIFAVMDTSSLFGGNETADDTEELPDETAADNTALEELTETSDEPADVMTEEDIQESLITVDRSGIDGSGNTLKVTEETDILLPLTVTNPTDRKARFTLSTSDETWVAFVENKVVVEPETSETVDVMIVPDYEVLDDMDYTVAVKAKLEGSKIEYEEDLEFTVTKKKPFAETYWPWLLAGVIAVLIIIMIIALAKRPREEKPAKPAKKTPRKAATPAKKPEKSTKKDEEGGSLWVPIVVGLVILVFIVILSVLAYTVLHADNTDTVVSDEESISEPIEETADTSAEPVVEETAEERSVSEKITEDDVPESLITIDRNGIAGTGNVLKLEDESNIVPLSIYNPTDRKAIFSITTYNNSWITFNEYNVVVDAESVASVDMQITPDMEELSKNDYTVSINANLQGTRIDYEENLDFVLSKKKAVEWSWLVYALIGLVVLGVIILIAEIVRRGKDDDVKGAAGKKAVKKQAKSIKRPAKNTNSQTKDVAQINKDIAALRKKTVFKLKKK